MDEKRSGLDILLTAEREAKRMEAAARAYLADMPTRIEAGKSGIYANVQNSSRQAIEKARAAEHEAADKRIEELERKKAERLAAMKKKFDAERDEYVREIYEMISGESYE